MRYIFDVSIDHYDQRIKSLESFILNIKILYELQSFRLLEAYVYVTSIRAEFVAKSNRFSLVFYVERCASEHFGRLDCHRCSQSNWFGRSINEIRGSCKHIRSVLM